MLAMGNPSKAPGFRDLLQEWNERLHESGFRDIEVQIKSERILRTPGSQMRYLMMDETTRSARAQFFHRLSNLVQTAKFKDEQERQILTLYAQGVRQNKIQEMLQIDGHRCKVYRPIYRWLRRWGLKE